MLYLFLLLLFLTAVSLLRLIYEVTFAGKNQTKARLGADSAHMAELNLTVGEGNGSLGLQDKLSRLFLDTSLNRRFQQLIARSYIRITPDELLKMCLLTGLGFGLFGWLAGSNISSNLLVFLLGLFVPPYALRLIGLQRAKKLSKQLPQALTILSNGLRAGFSFMQALSIVSREMESPIADEFNKILRESQLGKPMDEALQDFEERANDEDAAFLVSTLLIQMQVGGDLAEILDIIAHTIRERVQLKGQINTLTSQSKFSALIISVLPVALAGFIYLINPEYMNRLFTHPLGLMMVAAAAVMMLLGMMVLYKIVNIKM